MLDFLSQHTNIIIPVLLLLLGLLLILLAIAFFNARSNSNKFEEEHERYENANRNFYKAQQNYEQYKGAVQAEEQAKKEVEKRRRITQKTKEYVLARDKYTCQICGISKQFLDNYCDGLGDYLLLEVDHIQSVANGGSGDDSSNLQCLCWRCNRKKGGKKTNSQVIAMIDYGIKYLLRNMQKQQE